LWITSDVDDDNVAPPSVFGEPMELRDAIASMKGPPTFYEKVLEELKRLSEARGLEFLSEGKEEWGLHSLVRPGKRTFFCIEDKERKRAILVLILVPDPKRIHSETAWNRIEEPLRVKLSNFERNGYEGGTIKCVLAQVWETEKRIILLPLKELSCLKKFRDTGDFHVKKDGGVFVLQTPRWEDNVKLRDGLEDLLRLL